MVIPVLELGLIATERLENGILKKINKIDRTDIKETRKGLRENKKRYKSESKKKKIQTGIRRLKFSWTVFRLSGQTFYN